MNSITTSKAWLTARHAIEHLAWKIGKTDNRPSHIVKRKIILEYAQNYSIDTFVETGTYLGEMVDAVKNNFKKIYSIELAPVLFKRAVAMFKQYPHISIIEGDSSKVLPTLLPQLSSTTLFWLDGHFSGGATVKGIYETPIIAELDSIFRLCDKPYVILIDDARCFNGTHDYPTLDELRTIIQAKKAGLTLEVKDDIIRIVDPALKK